MKKIISVKLFLISAFLLIANVSAQPEGGEGRPVPWEALIVNPDRLDNERVQLDGYLKVKVLDVNRYEFLLYMDKDSMDRRRNFRFVEIDSREFMKALAQSGIEGLDNTQALDRQFLIIKAKFMMSKIDSKENLDSGRYRIGLLKGPFYCVVDESDKPVIRNH